jgi:hypothetical protein
MSHFNLCFYPDPPRVPVARDFAPRERGAEHPLCGCRGEYNRKYEMSHLAIGEIQKNDYLVRSIWQLKNTL